MLLHAGLPHARDPQPDSHTFSATVNGHPWSGTQSPLLCHMAFPYAAVSPGDPAPLGHLPRDPQASRSLCPKVTLASIPFLPPLARVQNSALFLKAYLSCYCWYHPPLTGMELIPPPLPSLSTTQAPQSGPPCPPSFIPISSMGLPPQKVGSSWEEPQPFIWGLLQT